MKVQQRKKALLNVLDFGDDSHPLHLIITENHARRLDIEEDNFSFVTLAGKRCFEADIGRDSSLSFSSPNSTHSSKTNLSSPSHPYPPSSTNPDQNDSFSQYNPDQLDITACVKIIDREHPISTQVEADFPEISSYCVVVTCSLQFLSHYQISVDDDFFVRKITVFQLQKVVIGVAEEKTFEWLNKIKFDQWLQTKVCQHPVLVRTNDIFLASYPEEDSLTEAKFDPAYFFDMIILEACPLRQGIITVNTEIIFSYSKEKDEIFEPIHLEMPGKRPKSNGLDTTNYFVSDFCQPLIPDSLKLNAKTIGVQKLSASGSLPSFDVEVVQQEVLWRKLLNTPQRDITFDPMNIIGMTKNTMLHNGFFEESLVKVSFESNSKIENVHYRIGLVKCVSDTVEKTNKVFVSPLLVFNLQKTHYKHGHKTPLIIEKYHCDGEKFGTASSSWSTAIPVATEVHMSVVNSPYYHVKGVHTEAVKAFFQVPRLVTKDDILPIKSSDDPEFLTVTVDADKRNPVVFYKVVKVDGPKATVPCYIVDKVRTKVVQFGSCHSYVPALALSYLTDGPLTYWDQTYLHGMNKYADHLEKIIRPHLQHGIDKMGYREVLPTILLTGPSGCGKTTLAITVAKRLHLHIYKVNCHMLYGEASGATESRLRNIISSATTYSPCILLLHSIHALGKDKERNTEDPRVANTFRTCMQDLPKQCEYPVVVIGTTSSANKLAADVHETFLHQLQIESPDENERAEMLDGLLQSVCYAGDLSGQYLAQRTAGFVLGDMTALVSHAKREAYTQVLKFCSSDKQILSLEEENDLAMAGVVVQQEDFVKALDQLQAAHSDTIGAPKIPSVKWRDVGGLLDVKAEILDTIQLPLQYPELLAAGLRRSGVLLYGPPGTGKTLLAKAVATECSLNFLSVKGPELINMYVGQSEQNIREVFERARSATPCVIFFDELDSLAPNRGKSGDSGGVMDRVVSQLLAELDGLHKSSDVFVIGATNRPDLLDPALLRPGRFDKLLYLGVSQDTDSQLKILQALTRKFKLEKNLELRNVVEKCPKNLTGADFYALASDAMLNALKRKITMLEAGETTDQENVIVSENDFLQSLSALTPSLSDDEMKHYEELRAYFSGNSAS
ncbi:peroxisomal ATPase PEX6-like [Mytilus galloprovincialis]|uniref:Peroxisomal ATPase PEX6 n=1 Tax=Mytilus galloprovincialis TaxID=29158 RepID=A0A8B6EMB8_MYTGA|nr:peroxin-6 [Mytilus galloprovincialis]